jgi:exoribonuclease-2
LCALAPGKGERLHVVDEDGRSFEYPAARLLWRAPTMTVPGATDRECAAALRVLRTRLGERPDWSSFHGRVPEDVPLDPSMLLPDGTEAAWAALAARAEDAAPWFRIVKGRLTAVSPETLEAERGREEEKRRLETEDRALVERLRAPPESETAIEVAPAAIERLLTWATGPDDTERWSGTTSLGVHDPDDALDLLDARGLLPADRIASLLRRGISRGFPAAVVVDGTRLAAAPDPATGRRDLGPLQAWAVDDAETVEVDDAVSVVRGPGGEPHLLIHISDAAAGIPPGCAVDVEARRRAVTGYLPDLRVPMVPPELNLRRLSLAPGESREAITLEVRVGSSGAPEVVDLFRSRVTVTARMDYDAVARVDDWPAALRPALDMVRSFARVRGEAGARSPGLPQRNVRVRDGVPVVSARGGGDGDLLVGESMVTFNAIAAERLRAGGAAALWRCQDPPRGAAPPREDPLYPVRARRMFAPARLSPVPAPHAGLGLSCYVQATSPIRRYSDLIHQRQLAALLEGAPPPHDAAELTSIAADLHRREKELHMAEGEREAYWLVRWLEARRGETFDAVCSRAPQRGRGFAWVPVLHQECPFRVPEGRIPVPIEGTLLRLVPGRLSRHRGRLEFDLSD